MKITREIFGSSTDGRPVQLFTLYGDGITAKVTNYGGIVTSLSVPDRWGYLGDVVLGFDNLDQYRCHWQSYMGALVGRYANRIRGASFVLEDKEYRLAANDGVNHLHGGIDGFDKKVWRATIIGIDDEKDGAAEIGVKLSYHSEDGEEGYPGNLTMDTIISVGPGTQLNFRIEAITDKATPVNFTHHGYFNLNDGGASSVLDHELTLYADYYTELNAALIPTGQIKPVQGTPLNFRQARSIGSGINDALGKGIGMIGGGYDQNLVINRWDGSLQLAAVLEDPVSGRRMDVLTTEPGIQIFTAQNMDGSITGKDGINYNKFAGFCLEAQHFPDSLHHPHFPDTILKPGCLYRQETVYRFSVTE